MEVGTADTFSRHRVRRYLLSMVGAALGLTLLLGGANVIVDPRSEFPSEAFTALVPDVPAEKIELLEDLDAEPRTFVFGSSRSEAIPTSTIEDETGAPAFNMAIHGGRVPDHAILYDHLQASGYPVEQVIIGLDDVSLAQSQSSSQITDLWRSSVMTGLELGPIDLVRRAVSSLSVDYLLDSWKVVRMTVAGEFREVFRFDREGVVHYPQFERAVQDDRYPTTGRVNRTVRLWDRSHYSPDHPGYREVILRELDALARRMSADGVRLKVFLTPFHPLLVERVEHNPRFAAMQREIDRHITELCAPNVEVYDFRFEGDRWSEPQHWRDGVHAYHEVGEDIVRTMYAGDGNLCAQETG